MKRGIFGRLIEMKSSLTKKIEYLIFKYTDKIGISGCREVKMGTLKTREFLTGEEEFVDYMTITSDGEITCYEIKSSIDDLKSSARLSFLGHRNFLVMPSNLYKQVESQRWFLGKLENHSIGIITVDDTDKLQIVKKMQKKKTSNRNSDFITRIIFSFGSKRCRKTLQPRKLPLKKGKL